MMHAFATTAHVKNVARRLQNSNDASQCTILFMLQRGTMQQLPSPPLPSLVLSLPSPPFLLLPCPPSLDQALFFEDCVRWW